MGEKKRKKRWVAQSLAVIQEDWQYVVMSVCIIFLKKYGFLFSNSVDFIT